MSPHLSLCQWQGMTCQKPSVGGERERHKYLPPTPTPREVQKQVRLAQEAWGKQASGEMGSFFSVKNHPALVSAVASDLGLLLTHNEGPNGGQNPPAILWYCQPEKQ